jgi:redox-sensitive bicupin YhaK (pirin superfamily)
MRSHERGSFDHGWLKTQHSFSFGDYYDPEKMGYRSLRVINEDYIQAGQGFPTHGHRDMEIITYIIDGALAHKDSTGGEGVIRPGEVQRMTAGRGIRHSEFNYLKNKDTHLLQIWILPNKEGHIPGYEQKDFSTKLNNHGLHLVASIDGREGSLSINQDADLYVGRLGQGETHNYELKDGRGLWLQVVSGKAIVNSEVVNAGDAISSEKTLAIASQSPDLEFLLFDLE